MVAGTLLMVWLIFTFKTFGQIIYYVLGVPVIYGGGANVRAGPPCPRALQLLIRLRCCSTCLTLHPPGQRRQRRLGSGGSSFVESTHACESRELSFQA